MNPKKKKTFSVSFARTLYTTIEVKAKDSDEALSLAIEKEGELQLSQYGSSDLQMKYIKEEKVKSK